MEARERKQRAKDLAERQKQFNKISLQVHKSILNMFKLKQKYLAKLMYAQLKELNHH